MSETDPRSLFDKFMKCRGGLVTINALPGWPFLLGCDRRARWMCEYVFSHEYDKNRSRLHFDFILNKNINACAFVGEGFDFVGVNIGAIYTLYNIFQRFLCHPEILPHIGKPEDTIKDDIIFPALCTDFHDKAYVQSEDHTRVGYAGILTMTAFEFLIAHELCHLRNGHVDLIAKRLNLTAMEERPFKLADKISGLASQALEMDADCGAVIRSMNQAFLYKKNLPNLIAQYDDASKTAYSHAYGDSSKCHFTVLFAAYTLMRVFDLEYWDEAHLQNYTHPPFPIRRSWIIQTVGTALGHNNSSGISLEEFAATTMLDVIGSVEHACAMITGQVYKRENIVNGFGLPGSKTYNHLNEVEEKWKEIRPSLEKLKRGGKLAS